jgi:hypothetical protein
MEALGALESPLDVDLLSRPPKMMTMSTSGAPSKYDGPSIALYVLSIIGLVLFIIVMIIYIVHTIQVSKRQQQVKDIIQEVPASLPPVVF